MLFIEFLTPETLKDIGITLMFMLFVFYFVYRFLDIQLISLKKRAEFDFLDTYHIVKGEVVLEGNSEPVEVDLIVISTKKKPLN